MLKDIKKNNYNLYYKDDIADFKLPMFKLYTTPENFYSKSRLKKEKKVTLSEELENNPHAFSQGRNGYYPVWDINKLGPKKVFRLAYFAEDLQHVSFVAAFDEDQAAKLVGLEFNKDTLFELYSVQECDITTETIIHTEIIDMI